MTKIAELQRNEAGIAAALDELAQAFGPNLLTGQAIREQHGHTTTWIETQAPDGVVMARSTDDVAQAVLFLASEASRRTTGAELLVDGGMAAQ